MMRSLYAGVSGLQNHQTRMDTIGNNVSNVNTTGFKKGRVQFQDMISQTLQGAARPREEIGGIDPKQIGLGMQIASIDTLHNQGSLQTTGVKSDLAIQGNGFFVLRDGENQFYTRDGSFSIDEEGMLVNPANGMRVQGWAAEQGDGEARINTSESVQDLSIPVGSKDPAQETTEVFLASNLNKNTPEIPEDATQAEIDEGTWTVEYDIYDSYGNTHTLRVDWTKVDDVANQWEAAVQIDPEQDVPPNQAVSVAGVDSADDQTFLVDFANDGTIQQVSNADGGVVDEGELSVDVSYEVPESQVVLDEEQGLPLGPQTQTFSLELGEVGAFVDSMTQYASESSTKVFSQNGNAMGYLEDYRIDESGVITGIFSNGTKRPLGQVALASFTNPGGLEKSGENNYVQTNNSGLADIAESGVAGKGKVISGSLEMSNVDLAEEFTDMITTQRGFQGSSRTITTSDEMLQEILTLKR
ncbi:MAG: flagellar hook protein FlgE [Spirochaetaceae bacterium]